MTISQAFREVISPPAGISPYVPNEGAPVIVTELTGQKRQIVLRGRALPFRGPSFSSTQRVKTTYYTGNPEATQQLFGPTYDNTTFTGIWRDKYLQPQPGTEQAPVAVRGFTQPITAEMLIDCFLDLQRSGSTLEVTWSMYRRIGVLRRAELTPDRTEDQGWSLEFEWSSDGTVAPEQTPLQGLDPDAIDSAMTSLGDIWAAGAGVADLIQEYDARIFTMISELQGKVDEVLQQCRVLANAITLPTRVVQGIRSSATSIAELVGQLLTETIEAPYTVAMTSDGVAGLFTLEAFRRDLAFFGETLRMSVDAAASNLEARAQPDPLRVVIMDQSGSLRAIALREYGDADAWQTIADVNGFDSSSVSPGTQVIVPPAPGLTGVT